MNRIPTTQASAASAQLSTTLEEVVVSPLAFGGRPVAAQGAFRGANLFDDLPPESRRVASDWVLRDGPFFIWVTGNAASGLGFALDSGSKADCRWWLRVVGTVTVANGYVYLDARTSVDGVRHPS